MAQDEYREIIDRLARIETHITHLAEKNGEGDEVHKDLSKRVTRLERAMWIAYGVIVAICGLGTAGGVWPNLF